MFCVFLNVRYSNPKLMHVGHQYVASNFDPSTLKGLIAVDAYHISPDKGLGIFTFDNQANLEKTRLRFSESVTDIQEYFSKFRMNFIDALGSCGVPLLAGGNWKRSPKSKMAKPPNGTPR